MDDNFYQWLMEEKNINRDDPIGNLAQDMKRDSACPLPSKPSDRFYYGTLHAHLIYSGACREAIVALDEAWAEFDGLTPRPIAPVTNSNSKPIA